MWDLSDSGRNDVKVEAIRKKSIHFLRWALLQPPLRALSQQSDIFFPFAIIIFYSSLVGNKYGKVNKTTKLVHIFCCF